MFARYDSITLYTHPSLLTPSSPTTPLHPANRNGMDSGSFKPPCPEVKMIFDVLLPGMYYNKLGLWMHLLKILPS